MYRYPFEKTDFCNFKPSSLLETSIEMKFKETEKYFNQVKTAINSKAAGQIIEEISIKRVSFFSGVDIAIKYGY